MPPYDFEEGSPFHGVLMARPPVSHTHGCPSQQAACRCMGGILGFPGSNAIQVYVFLTFKFSVVRDLDFKLEYFYKA